MMEVDDRLFELERLVALLREELQNQWEYNHAEHCGGDLPCSGSPNNSYGCHWPVPAILEEANAAVTARFT